MSKDQQDEKGVQWKSGEKRMSGSGNSQCKGPAVGACLRGFQDSRGWYSWSEECGGERQDMTCGQGQASTRRAMGRPRRVGSGS